MEEPATGKPDHRAGGVLRARFSQFPFAFWAGPELLLNRQVTPAAAHPRSLKMATQRRAGINPAPTSETNAERYFRFDSMFDVGRWLFDVRLLS
ncbi:MAG: hypothetical protein MUF69_13450 [Desulfobacterota bacterium]|jgi:hypothetical protein|nr:hypothetical protein [Thermodesulfobacteriota bacterium]